MKRQLFLMAVILLTWTSPIQAAENGEKRVVNEVIDAIDCEGGEGDEQRSAQIAEESARFCSKAQHKAEVAYSKYPNNPELAARILELIDINYFADSGGTKKKICGTAATYFKNKYLAARDQDVTFRSVCPNHATSIYGK